MIKGILEFIAIIALLTGAFMFAEAYGAEPTATVKDFNPISVIVVEVNHTPQWFMLVNAEGTVARITVAECAASADCKTVVKQLGAAGHGGVLNLQTGADI